MYDLFFFQKMEIHHLHVYYIFVVVANFIHGIQQSREGYLDPSCYYGGLRWKS